MGRVGVNPEVSLALENMGRRGSIIYSDNSAHTPPAGGGLLVGETAYTAIVCVTATVFASLTSETMAPCTGYATVTFPANYVLRGSFTGLTLTSGTVQCYFGPRIEA